jgi:hypothetical protein
VHRQVSCQDTHLGPTHPAVPDKATLLEYHRRRYCLGGNRPTILWPYAVTSVLTWAATCEVHGQGP